MAQEIWPRGGQLVEVLLGGSEESLLAVIDDVRPPEQLHLREPVHHDGRPGPSVPLGTPIRLGWATAAGYHVLDVLLTGTPALRMPLWKLQPAGDVEVVQRRTFMRVADALPVELHRDGAMWLASICDLSEGGARCLLSARAPIEQGEHVQVAAEIGGDTIRVDSLVVAVERLDEARATVRLRFAELRREGDVIRRHVLDVQRRARALERL